MARSMYPGAAEFLPDRASMSAMRRAVQGCRGCDLYLDATQAVFGEGPSHAPIVLVGEQPGDREDREGHPFVGPAGRLLRESMTEAGLDPDAAYITNVVKHFKFIERGKRRIHQSPKVTEVRACAPWLEAELALVKPEVVVALGATAAKAIVGADFQLTQEHGRIVSSPLAPRVVATFHPSAILRSRDEDERRVALATFVDDLRVAREALT